MVKGLGYQTLSHYIESNARGHDQEKEIMDMSNPTTLLFN